MKPGGFFVQSIDEENAKIWQHPQFWPWAIQSLVLLLGLVALTLSLNLVAHLQQRQSGFSCSFLQSQAGVSINEASKTLIPLVPSRPKKTYLDAFWVGLVNSLLLLQIVFWYFAVFVSGPPFEQRLSILGELSFSQRGLLIPSFAVRLSFIIWLHLGQASAQARRN